MSASTRDQFIAVAEKLFARRGFYGASIADIARELGLTKQALLHHFGSKERLYGDVLQRISDELLANSMAIAEAEPDPALRLEELVVAQYRQQMADQDRARLIMRELLDNDQRAAKAASWYMRPYLQALVDTAMAIDSMRDVSDADALAMVYQFLGAAHYFAISQPTLKMVFGQTLLKATGTCFEQALRRQIRARLHSADGLWNPPPDRATC
jgi:AcrR family transcriptional regulator